MEKTRTKRVAVPLGDGSYRETTIELVQIYHDNTKKLVKTEEKARVEGKLYRVAKTGEKADTQLMDEKTFEVLSLVEISEKKAAPPPVPSKPAVKEEAMEAVEASEGADGDDETPEDGEEEADEDQPEIEEETEASPDDSEEVEDEMATKKKAAKKAVKKAAPKKEKAAKKAAPKKESKPKTSKGNGEAKAKAPSSGQSGPALDLSEKKLNSKEEKVLGALSNGSGKMTITDLTDLFKKSVKVSQANSWVRNSLRRLVRGGLVKKVERGSYEATAKGRKHAAS